MRPRRQHAAAYLGVARLDQGGTYPLSPGGGRAPACCCSQADRVLRCNRKLTAQEFTDMCAVQLSHVLKQANNGDEAMYRDEAIMIMAEHVGMHYYCHYCYVF